MNKKEKIEEQISKTLDQFEHAEQLPPNPYFYTRVQARLEETRRQKRVLSAILRPALLTALVTINLSTAVWYLGGSDHVNQSETRKELIEILAGDLKLDDNQSSLLDIK